VLGELGGGTAQHFGLEDQVSLIVATFSKSLASIGGVVAGAEPVIHYLKHHARSLIYSASMPPASVATVLAALDVIEEEPQRREALWRNTRRMQDGLKSLGYDVGESETPVIPVLIGDLAEMIVLWKQLFDSGIFTNPVIPPAVPEHSCRLRISIMATHTDEQIDYVLDAFAQRVRQLLLGQLWIERRAFPALHVRKNREHGLHGLPSLLVQAARRLPLERHVSRPRAAPRA